MAYRLLGSGTTDSNGRATYTYTGAGNGEIDVIASLDNPIVSSSVQSKPYPVEDVFVFDSGIYGSANETDRMQYQTRLTIETLSDGTGTLLTQTGNSNGTLAFNKHGSTISAWTDTIDYTVPFAIEVDIVSFSDNACGVFVGDSTFTQTFSAGAVGFTANSHLKMVFNGTTVKGYINNETTPSYSYNLALSSAVRCGLYVGTGSGKTLKYKNVKIYSV